MAVGVEQSSFIEVPVPQNVDRPDVSARFRFRDLTGDRIEVYHPFHGTSIIGDGSVISDPSLDAAATVLFRNMPYLVDSMKLNRPRRFETRPFAGEYSQLSHCFSLGLLAVEFGGGPMDVLDALYNDASHTYNGHQGDDNYQGHGQEDLHDKERAKFFERAGIVDALVEAGALRRRPSGIYVGATRLTIDRLLSEDEVTIRRSFLSNKHKSRRLDADRFQYNEEERFLTRWAANMDMPQPGRIPQALTDLSINTIARMIVLEDDEGDQLVYTDDQAALAASEDYVRHNAEHWCEPVQDLVNDILNLAERYFFVCDHPHARHYQYFYPRDYLHTSATLMFEQFDAVAKDDPAMKWLLDTAEHIAEHQRELSLQYLKGNVTYQGPQPPDGVQLERIDQAPTSTTITVDDQGFLIDLPRGKVRTINPRVVNGGGLTHPLTDMQPEFKAYYEEYHRWIGNYRANIEIPDPATRAAVARAVEQVREHWVQQLNLRPHMPPAELRRTIADANDFVKRIGRTASIQSR